MKNIEELNESILEAVSTSEYAEKTIVFGNGNNRTKIFLIGEAPGGEEEKQGMPFVGKAGKNLDEFIETVGLNRKDLYITNVVKLRPINISPKTGKPVNRTPNTKEIDFFLPFLKKEIEIVSPGLVVTLGNVPLKAVLGDKKITIGNVHGTLIETADFKIFPLYHPASVIYNRSLKDTYFADLEKIKYYI
ncbi:MAG: uracil-DNA glycosylase [Oscillospiraceae bacterium]